MVDHIRDVFILLRLLYLSRLFICSHGLKLALRCNDDDVCFVIIPVDDDDAYSSMEDTTHTYRKLFFFDSRLRENNEREDDDDDNNNDDEEEEEKRVRENIAFSSFSCQITNRFYEDNLDRCVDFITIENRFVLYLLYNQQSVSIFYSFEVNGHHSHAVDKERGEEEKKTSMSSVHLYSEQRKVLSRSRNQGEVQTHTSIDNYQLCLESVGDICTRLPILKRRTKEEKENAQSLTK